MESNKIMEGYSEEQVSELKRIISKDIRFYGWEKEHYLTSYPKELFTELFFKNDKAELFRFFNLLLDQHGKRVYKCIKTYPGCRFRKDEQFTTINGGTGYGGDIDNDGWWVKNTDLDKETEYYVRIS